LRKARAMRRVFWMIVMTALATQAEAASLTVVATTPDLAAIAREVGRDRVSVTSMAAGGQDPHFLDPRPSFLVKLNRADLLIEGGLDLEIGWLPALLASARNPKLRPGELGRLNASERIAVLGVPGGRVDRSQGDVHGKGNPHFLTDPVNGAVVADTIAQRLCRLDVEGCVDYRANAEAFRRRIDAAVAGWTDVLSPYRGTKIVAYHDTWSYFTKRFGLTTVGFVEPKPGVPPPPSHISALVDLIQREHVPVIVMEPYASRSIPDLVARQTGCRVLVLAPTVGALPATDDYVAMVDANVKALARALARTTSR